MSEIIIIQWEHYEEYKRTFPLTNTVSKGTKLLKTLNHAKTLELLCGEAAHVNWLELAKRQLYRAPAQYMEFPPAPNKNVTTLVRVSLSLKTLFPLGTVSGALYLDPGENYQYILDCLKSCGLEYETWDFDSYLHEMGADL